MPPRSLKHRIVLFWYQSSSWISRIAMVVRFLDNSMTVVILRVMKTAVSIPDPVFAAADALAHRLGLSRSELYATALRTYVDGHRQVGVRERLDAVYAQRARSPEVDPNLEALQARSLADEDW
jgi:antitoxin MazE6